VGSREEILAALRAAAPRPVPLPKLEGRRVTFEDVTARFAQSVEEAGARCLRPGAALEDALLSLEVYRSARRVASLVPGVAKANVDLSVDPHALEDVDFCVLAGELGVAENGAVWVRDFTGRAAAFLAQHLALVVPAQALVHDMHEAYERIRVGPGFGIFIAGPSKTADIEQALVIGAHGPRSCAVLLQS
jgi:L-lactate dehydrogenase complex protein LldG